MTLSQRKVNNVDEDQYRPPMSSNKRTNSLYIDWCCYICIERKKVNEFTCWTPPRCRTTISLLRTWYSY